MVSWTRGYAPDTPVSHKEESVESLCFICRALNTETPYLYVSPYSRQEIEICQTCFHTRLGQTLPGICSKCRNYKQLIKTVNMEERRIVYMCDDCLKA